MRALRQWVCWRAEDIGAAKPTKIPYSINGQKASVTNPSHWSSFDEVVRLYNNGGYSGIGFVFSSADPYTFIDLDATPDQTLIERQRKIFETFKSYSELSPSGEGLHIIVKGNVPQGRRRNAIEIYSNERYATFTGNVYLNEPIQEGQAALMELWESLGNDKAKALKFESQPEVNSDAEVIRIASEAANGNKFQALWAGDFAGLYPSQSEADISLINMIAFYTKNKMQVARIFRQSALGKRDKAKRSDYVGNIINMAFDRELPPIDIDALRIDVENTIRKDGDAFARNGTTQFNISPQGLNNTDLGGDRARSSTVEPTAHNGLVVGSTPTAPTNLGVSTNGKSEDFGSSNLGSIPSTPTKPFQATKEKLHLKPPPGLLGEIAQFIYQAAPRPVPEIAIAAAIGLMAGICGRAYNVSSTGLNQYVLLLAKTGRGKEAIQSGISKLIAHVRQQVPAIEECIGPDEIASGPALYKYLNKNPGFVSVLSEFGLRLASLSDSHGNGSNMSLRRMILQLYAKSGFNDVAHPSIYSDKDKNIAAIPSPAFSILGESTPHTFYRNLNEEMISEGLLPRFLLIEYDGERVAENVNHALAKPSNDLIDKLAQIAANANTVENSQPRRVITVNFSPEAAKISTDYSRRCDRFINDKSNNEVVIELWNRAHLKVLKLAAIVSVGINMWNPTIEREHLEWAIGMVDEDIKTLTQKFESGKIGANTQEVKQIDEVSRVIKEYATGKWSEIIKYCSNKDQKLFEEKVIPYGYISKRLVSVAAFRIDKMGATFAIKRTLQILLDRDHIQELSREQLKQKFGTTQKSYMISNVKLLEDDNEE